MEYIVLAQLPGRTTHTLTIIILFPLVFRFLHYLADTSIPIALCNIQNGNSRPAAPFFTND